MKECFKCGEVKPLSDFYKSKGMKDGHLNKCKECTKKDVRKNRSDNLEYYREYDRKRGNRQAPGYCKEYRKKYPVKYAAHNLINNLLRDGKITKPDRCQECGTLGRVDGHHDDYARPLEVRWLCPGCHHQWHAKHGEAANPTL